MRKAKTLTQEQFGELLDYVRENSLHPERDEVILMLSFKCGLRACEIARLLWTDVTLSNGEIIPANGWIELSRHITKGKKPETSVLMHKDVHDALVRLKAVAGDRPLIYSDKRGDGAMSVNGLTVYLHRLYKAFGVAGCSSHSGRRTYITDMARRCNLYGNSIKDVQRLARHSDIRTTETYIEPAPNLVDLAASA